MTLREQIGHELDALTELELKHVANYVAILKGKGNRDIESLGDEERMRALYAEFSDEDRSLAEAGMSDYSDGLAREDCE
jgi:hypothetical protein